MRADFIPDEFSEVRSLFVAIPRVGETVVLDWIDGEEREYVVEAVKHVQGDECAILHIRKSA